MELTPREIEVLKSILITEQSEADEMIIINNDPRDKAELEEFYGVVRSITNKLQFLSGAMYRKYDENVL